MKELLSVNEAAETLGCSPAAIRKWIYKRRLKPVNIYYHAYSATKRASSHGSTV